MHIYSRTAADNGEELGRAIPGANFRCVADLGASFGGRYWHLALDWLVLTRLEVDQATVVTTDERTSRLQRLARHERALRGEWATTFPAMTSSWCAPVRAVPCAAPTRPRSRHSVFSRPCSRMRRNWGLPFGPSSPGQSGRWCVASDAPAGSGSSSSTGWCFRSSTPSLRFSRRPPRAQRCATPRLKRSRRLAKPERSGPTGKLCAGTPGSCGVRVCHRGGRRRAYKHG